MLASAPPPPPPRLINSASAPGGKIDKQKQNKKSLQHEKVERPREIGALESSGPIAYATFATRLIQHTAMMSLYLFALFKIRPYKLGRRPLQGLRPGAMPPPAPPPRYATESGIYGASMGIFVGWSQAPTCLLYSTRRERSYCGRKVQTS